MGFDTKCYDLAEAFLDDEGAINTPANVNRLAQVIQDAIEGELEAMKNPPTLIADAVRRHTTRDEDK